jgi:hypothetical protein
MVSSNVMSIFGQSSQVQTCWIRVQNYESKVCTSEGMSRNGPCVERQIVERAKGLAKGRKDVRKGITPITPCLSVVGRPSTADGCRNSAPTKSWGFCILHTKTEFLRGFGTCDVMSLMKIKVFSCSFQIYTEGKVETRVFLKSVGYN